MHVRWPALVRRAIGCAGLAAMFVLPWRMPTPTQPGVSDSSAVGFSNVTAILCVALTCVILFALGCVWRREDRAVRPGPLWPVEAAQDGALDYSYLLTVGAVTVALTVPLFWLTHGVAYGDSRYFLDRMAFATQGYRPFTGFEYAYSYVSLYLPIVMWKLLAPLGADPQSGYFASIILLMVTSWWMLFSVIDDLGLFSRQKRRLFLSVATVSFVLVYETLGSQYLLVRFLAPLIALRWLHRGCTRRLETSQRRPWVGMGVAAVGVVLWAVLWTSPEVTVACAVAVVVYFAALMTVRGKEPIIALVVYLVAMAALTVAFGGAYARYALQFGHGGYYLPVLPGPPTIVVVMAVFIVAGGLPRALRGMRGGDRAAALAIAAFAMTLLPAMLGRADSVHLLVNGLAVMLLAAVLLQRRSRRAFAAGLGVFTVVFGAASAAYLIGFSGPRLLAAGVNGGAVSRRALVQVAGVVGVSKGRAERYYQRTHKPAQHFDLRRLDAFAPLFAPLGFQPVDLRTGFYLAGRRRLGNDFTYGLVLSRGDLDTQLARLRTARYLLVSNDFAREVSRTDARQTGVLVHGRRFSATLYLWIMLCPVGLRQTHPVADIRADLAAYIHGRFLPMTQTGPYTVYVRRTPQP
jgi:hypothetical protein